MRNFSQNIIKSIFILGVFLFSQNASSYVFEESFSTALRKDSTTAVWNLASEKLHPPLKIYGWNDLVFSGPYDKSIDVGDGSNGPFNSSTYSNFGTVVGSVITIDTDVYSELNVTNFVLDAGYTLRPTGSNPLIIRSHQNIIINGIIDCSGEDGENLNSDDSVVSSGGAGRCGGVNGGDGGSTLSLPADGQDAGVSVTGGTAGGVGGGAGGVGGGGGGSHSFTGALGDNGEDPNVVGMNDGGAAGTIDNTDHAYNKLEGGAGGGGGSVFDQADPKDSSGGGGGAGGGVIILVAVGDITIDSAGRVYADGGAGGGDAGLLAGGGGGGGGGSVALWAGDQIVNNGLVRATGGSGGATDSNLANGGNGVDGRVWASEADAISGTGSENPGVLYGDPGLVKYDEGSFVTTSVAIDLANTSPNLQTLNMTTQTDINNTITTEFAHSNQPGFDPTGSWDLFSNISNASIGRYIRFRVTLNNTDRTQLGAEVQNIQVVYNGNIKTDFDLQVTGCGMVKNGNLPGHKNMLLLLLVFPLILAISLKTLALKKP